MVAASSLAIPELAFGALRGACQIHNLTILGLSVQEVSPPAVLSKMGNAPIISRGPADTLREQVCYKSGYGRVKLVFEQGEYEGLVKAFYLFEGGNDWRGSD